MWRKKSYLEAAWWHHKVFSWWNSLIFCYYSSNNMWTVDIFVNSSRAFLFILVSIMYTKLKLKQVSLATLLYDYHMVWVIYAIWLVENYWLIPVSHLSRTHGICFSLLHSMMFFYTLSKHRAMQLDHLNRPAM